MARGWESKSVEAQQDEAKAGGEERKIGQPTPEQLAARRKREGLVMMRKKIEHDLASATNPRHREMLEKALADLQAQLRKSEE
jgi:hypothetical protein